MTASSSGDIYAGTSGLDLMGSQLVGSGSGSGTRWWGTWGIMFAGACGDRHMDGQPDRGFNGDEDIWPNNDVDAVACRATGVAIRTA